MLTILLFVILAALCVLSFILSGRKLTSPAVIFNASFALSILNGLINYNKFKFDLHWNTVQLILLGAMIFTCISLLMEKFLRPVFPSAKDESVTTSADVSDGGFHVPILLYFIGMALAVISCFVMAAHVIAVSTQHGGPSDIIGAMGRFDQLSKFGSVDTSTSGLVGNYLVLTEATFYIWAYVFAKKRNGSQRHIDWGALLIMTVLVICSLLSGGRNSAIQLIFSAGVIYIIFYERRRAHEGTKSDRKILVAVLLAVVLAVVLFRPILALLGRDAGGKSGFDYISLYLGAPIKNLDLYLNGELPNPITVTSTYFGEQTFSMMYMSLSKWTGIATGAKWTLWQPFQSVNGVDLGNVYSIYYTFVFDWGYFGALVAVGITAFLSETVYLFATNERHLRFGALRISVLAYSIIAYGLAFCFFMNFLTKAIVGTGFVRYLAIWTVISFAPMLVRRLMHYFAPQE